MLDQGVVFIIGLPLLMIIVFIRDIRRKNKNESVDYNREFVWILLVIYILLIISLFMFPLKIDLKSDLAKANVNIIPIIYTIEKFKLLDMNNKIHIIHFLKEVGGALLVIMPVGMFLPILYKRFRSLKNILIGGTIIAVLIESINYILYYLGNDGTFNIDNILFKILGTLIGYFIYNVFVIKINKFLFEDI